jgi:hypothetical protein
MFPIHPEARPVRRKDGRNRFIPAAIDHRYPFSIATEVKDRSVGYRAVGCKICPRISVVVFSKASNVEISERQDTSPAGAAWRLCNPFGRRPVCPGDRRGLAVFRSGGVVMDADGELSVGVGDRRAHHITRAYRHVDDHGFGRVKLVPRVILRCRAIAIGSRSGLLHGFVAVSVETNPKRGVRVRRCGAVDFRDMPRALGKGEVGAGHHEAAPVTARPCTVINLYVIQDRSVVPRDDYGRC